MPCSAFNSACWDGTGFYYNGEPLAEVLFTPYDFCIEGFADGNSAADAP